MNKVVYNAYLRLCINTWFFSPQITSNGVFSFEEVGTEELQFLQFESSNTGFPSQLSSTPLIATLWTLTPSEQEGNRTLYTRVAQDNTTLGLVRDMIAAENTELSDYQPTVAIVVTWTRELMVHTVCTVHVCLHAMQLVWIGHTILPHMHETSVMCDHSLKKVMCVVSIDDALEFSGAIPPPPPDACF